MRRQINGSSPTFGGASAYRQSLSHQIRTASKIFKSNITKRKQSKKESKQATSPLA
jgi:hypothetical protein